MNLRGIAKAVISYFKKSLQARYTATTVILSGVALVAVGGFLAYSIGSGLFATRLDQVVKDSARSASEVQNIFSSASTTNEIGLQSIMNSIVPNLESSTTSEPRRVALLRAPGQQASVVLQSPISLDLDTAVIPEGLRATVRNTPGKVVYQSVSLPVVNSRCGWFSNRHTVCRHV